MDMYISWIRLRLGGHRKTAVELLALGTLLRVVMREIEHVHRAGLGSAPIRRNAYNSSPVRRNFKRPIRTQFSRWHPVSFAFIKQKPADF